VRDRLDLTAELAGHRASVVAEALVERSLEPLSAVGVRKQPIDPGAERGCQCPSGPGFLGRHVACVARRLRLKPGPTSTKATIRAVRGVWV
jgi:hypothetical protein